tara:strand:- start:542 stop:682 length:141 start_codon:yes stop_codon:yes gene_type:complete
MILSHRLSPFDSSGAFPAAVYSIPVSSAAPYLILYILAFYFYQHPA